MWQNGNAAERRWKCRGYKRKVDLIALKCYTTSDAKRQYRFLLRTNILEMIDMVISQSIEQRLSDFLNSASTRWVYGNKVLYNMCMDNPRHDDADIIVGKIWLIGRSYAAAIERTKGAGEAHDFYYDIVAPKLLSVGKELDRRIVELNAIPHLSNQSLDSVLNTHKFLVDVFSDITNKEKRSLASKYLHFHCPAMFFIYDSRARIAIRKVVKINKDLLYEHYSCGCDTEYADFCVRALELQKYIEEKCGKNISPREIDNFLLYF